MKVILKCSIVFVLLICIFVALLVLSSSFPSSAIKNNVQASAKVLYNEGNRKIVYIPYRFSNIQFDNYTDALMINTAYSIDSTTPLEAVFLARKNYIPNVTKTIQEDKVGELKSSSKYMYHNEVGELLDLTNNEAEESFEYARYWHGYLIVLRPLLVIFNLNTIRVLLTIALIILFIAFFILLEKKTNIFMALFFELGLFCVEYFYLGYTLQGIFVFLIAVITSIIILIKDIQFKNNVLLFFVVGMLTNFFDFLTVPMVTYGIPMLVILLINEKKEDYKWTKSLLDIIKLGIAWCIGYGLTWFTKWLLTDLFLHKNLISVALQQVKYRSIGREYSLLQAIYPNLDYEILFIILTVILTLALVFKQIKNKSIYKNKTIKEIIPFFLITILPYIWYAVLKNHSAEHSFFTYRNQVLTVIGINICFFKMILLEKEVKK